MNKINKILLVDDDPIQNLINNKLIKRLELANEVFVAVNGKDAFDSHISKFNELPEIIFLDINMPIMNGWEFLTVLKEQYREKKPIIYMLTSSISPDDIRKSEENPMVVNYITKPLSMIKLEAVKNEILDSI